MTAPAAFENVTKWWGAQRALHGFTAEVHEGRITALLGRNGAGKTTAIGCLLGFVRPTSGRARLLGHDTTALPPSVRARVAYVAEGERLVPAMRLSELADFQAATVPAFDRALHASWVARLGLPADARVRHLSRGQRAQAALALALAQRPELAILDDPALGLDVAVRREFLEVMIDLIQEEGRTVLFTSHVLQDVERVADRVVILDGGRMRVDAPLDELKARVRRVHAVFGGGDAPEVPAMSGLVRSRRRGDRWTLTFADPAGARTAADRARALGASSVDDEPLSLEDAFLDLTEPALTGGVA